VLLPVFSSWFLYPLTAAHFFSIENIIFFRGQLKKNKLRRKKQKHPRAEPVEARQKKWAEAI
jgi:hypothetical protein